MQCFYITQEEKMMQISIHQIKEVNRPYCVILSKEEWKRVYQTFNVSEMIKEACLNIGESNTVEFYGQYDLGILQRMKWEQGSYRADSVRFLSYKKALFIIVDELYVWLNTLMTTLINEKEIHYTLGYLFYRLIDCVIAEDKKYLEQMEKRTEQLEEEVLNEVVQHFIQDIIGIRKQITIFKRHYDPLADIIEDFISNENEMCTQEDIRYFKILKNRINRLNHLIDTVDDYATHVREAYDAQIDIRLNRIMKYFTLMTSLFFPLTLIVGWYGMNFTSMPEVSWKYGYLYVIILSILSSILCLYFFKKKKWL
ncbi:MAG: hypothetical protein E7231_02560 [Cellulosilyticum sp.]|nr:hypothetical protein [Cellulosilyticum sp.]